MPKNIKALKKRLMQLRHFNERVSTELSESIREYEKEKWDIKGWNMWEVSSYKGNSCNFLQQNYTCTNSFLVRLVCDRNQLLVSVLYQNENFTEFARYYFIYFTKIQHFDTLSSMPLSNRQAPLRCRITVLHAYYFLRFFPTNMALFRPTRLLKFR